MELLEAINRRRSVRAFKPRDVPEETVEEIVDAARHAPSAGNIPSWAFVIARKLEITKKLAKAACSPRFSF